ncbi:MAG: hypothetical protein RR495_02390 [Anaerovoracaceae bacterium]
MSKLSKREKILIYIMAWMLILAGGVYFLVMPALVTHDEAVLKYNKTLIEAQEMKNAIKNKGIVSVEIDEAKLNIKQMDKYFYKYLENKSIDRLITGVVLKSGLTPYDLEIGEVAKDENGEVITDTGVGEAVKDETQSTGETAGEDKTTTVNGNADRVRTSVTSIRARGSFVELTKFLAEARKEKGVRVDSFEFKKIDETTGVSEAVLGEKAPRIVGNGYELTATILIYQINKY